MPGLNDILQWSEYAMAPLSGLVVFFVIKMMFKLVPQYRAARSKWRPDGETEQEKDALLYSTKEELISGGFMLANAILLSLLFLLVFAPWWDPLPSSIWRGLVVRLGLDLIIFLMLGHSIARSRYWDRLAEILPVKSVEVAEPDPWDQVTERRKPRE